MGNRGGRKEKERCEDKERTKERESCQSRRPLAPWGPMQGRLGPDHKEGDSGEEESGRALRLLGSLLACLLVYVFVSL